MIEAYSWTTPNGQKLHIILEETGLDYELHPVPLSEGAQHQPEYLRINPNGKIPAIVDTEGPDGAPLAIMESGAILLHLAEKSGMLLPGSPRARSHALQWLFFQVGHVGPMFGQSHHFDDQAPERDDYAIQRYARESARLMSVLERRLATAEHLAGDDYSIADIATWPWISSGAGDISLDTFPGVRRWFDAVGQRPAVKRGMAWMRETGG